jgi:hypothetical protein
MNDGCKSKPGLARVRAYAALLLALRVVPAAGGVVITQELTMPDDEGGTKNVTHTMMIEGNHLKTVSAEGIAIMDLDKETLTVLDAKNKTATQMPLGNVLSPMAAGFTGELKPTGKHRKVAGYSCEEFTRDFMSAGGNVTSTSCISKDAPGAAEAAAFYKKMAAKSVGHDVTGMPDGVSLSEETSVQSATEAITGVPPDMAKQIGDALAKQPARKNQSEVTSIKADKLGADTFAVPAGYKVSKGGQGGPGSPADASPGAH